MNIFYIFLFVLLIVLASFIFFDFFFIKKIKFYLFEIKSEFFKISWAKKLDVIKTTLIVFFVVFVLSLLIWIIDMFFFKIIEKILFNVGVY